MGDRITTGMSEGDERERLVFYKEDIVQIHETLTALLKNCRARCVLVADKVGHILTREGKTGLHDADTLTGMVVTTIPSLKKSIALVGGEGLSVLYRQDRKDNVLVTLVGNDHGMAIVFESAETFEMTRMYADQVSQKLSQLFAVIAGRARGGEGPAR